MSVATESGWSPFSPAVVDTGAPVSLLPPSIWKDSRYTPLGRVRVGGLARRPECQLPAVLAEIECTVSDGQHSLRPIRMHAYLVETEDAPRLIGMLGFIERGVVRVELSKDRAFLRMPRERDPRRPTPRDSPDTSAFPFFLSTYVSDLRIAGCAG